LPARLDWANHVETVAENRFFAHWHLPDEQKGSRRCRLIEVNADFAIARRPFPKMDRASPLREQKITCAEVHNARDGEVIICIKVNDGVSTGHLDIQVAKVVDVIRCQSREVNPISPFEIGRVMPVLSGKDKRIRAASAKQSVVPDAARERVVAIAPIEDVF
jgi:hypothetical protein